jgi:hypothetical protein
LDGAFIGVSSRAGIGRRVVGIWDDGDAITPALPEKPRDPGGGKEIWHGALAQDVAARAPLGGVMHRPEGPR